MEKVSLKGVLKNFVLNFFSYAMPTVVLQFIVQPVIANKLGADLNGQYLALMSLNYFFIGITASVLNTVRMIQNEKYERANVLGDFNIIFLVYAIIIILLMPLGYIFYVKTPSLLDVFLYVLVGLLYLYHDYVFAQYRLRMQFNKILINNLILVLGYFLGGVLFFFVVPKWQLIFVTAYTMSGIFDFFNTDFIREPLKRTKLFKQTVAKVGSLMVANSLSSSIGYFDKLLLYPLLGGFAVSVYHTASLVGKILYLVSAPMNTLLLSYLVKMERFDISVIKKHLVKAILFLVSGYVICCGIGYPLSSLLYPEWASQSYIFIPITVAANVFSLVGNLANTVIVRYYKTSIQMIIHGVNLVLYLAISLSFMFLWGLLGFSIGIALVSGIKMIVLIVFISKMDRQKTKNKGDET